VLNTDSKTVDFMRGVLDELVDVFGSEYIHLGGDEVPAAEWSASPAAGDRMRQLGLSDPGDLLGWWITQLADHLKGLGRRVVLWDELVEHGAPPGATIMAWRGRERVAAALRAGHDVVATPHTDMYLNYPQAAGPGEPLSIADGDNADIGVTSLATTYAYDPEPAEPIGTGARVIGVQGNLWTEYAPTPQRAEYDLMPRLAAVAEVAWGSPRDEADLRERLVTHLRRLDAAGIGYRPL
jgi:hexosaminidase